MFPIALTFERLLEVVFRSLLDRRDRRHVQRLTLPVQ